MKSSQVICFPLMVFIFGFASVVTSQIPEKFQNLQVLPKETNQKQLLETMKGFTSGLGVRCPYCHVGEEGKELSTFNFVSDEKETKKKARLMMKMVTEINTKFIAEIEEDSETVTVKCATCHHGLSKPDTIEDALLASMKEGLTSAVERYKELKKTYYGSDAYNFQPAPLNRLARTLLKEKKNMQAVKILQLNFEMHPGNVEIPLLLADAFLANGEKENALQALTQAVKLDPKNEEAQKKIQELKNQN